MTKFRFPDDKRFVVYSFLMNLTKPSDLGLNRKIRRNLKRLANKFAPNRPYADLSPKERVDVGVILKKGIDSLDGLYSQLEANEAAEQDEKKKEALKADKEHVLTTAAHLSDVENKLLGGIK